MIKIEELMIGDIVRVNKDVSVKKGTIVKVREIDGDRRFQELTGCISCVAIDDIDEITAGVWLAYIDPIPLTPEILEANGWEKKWHDRSKCTIFDPKNDNVTLIVYNHYNATVTIEALPFNLVNGENMRGQVIDALGCRYVHELQHALRLCGIDKEIIVKKED